MSLDYAGLDLLRRSHPAWRLLRSDHAPLVASFLQRVFIEPNVRQMQQADLAEALEDELFALREKYGEELFPKRAVEYLSDWADNDKGWLRKYYPTGSDEPHFDLTSASEKAIAWLASLTERAFVGTESRLLTLFALLRQMSEGSETDPAARTAELIRRRSEIDAEIERIRDGDISLMGDTALKDRFQQFLQLARDLLADFREVEQNFRSLDRQVRERIALWDGAKGELLEEIMGQRDTIADSDQGKSFRAFWDFLMSQSRQEELSRLLEQVLTLPPVVAMQPESRLRRVHYDWLEAGEHTQRTVARLSQQLRRFLDDQAWLENRRIMDILHNIEAQALAVREEAPTADFIELAEASATVESADGTPPAPTTGQAANCRSSAGGRRGGWRCRGALQPGGGRPGGTRTFHPPGPAGAKSDKPCRAGGPPSVAPGFVRAAGLSAAGRRTQRYGGGRGNDRVAYLAAWGRQLSPRPFAAHYFYEEMT